MTRDFFGKTWPELKSGLTFLCPAYLGEKGGNYSGKRLGYVYLKNFLSWKYKVGGGRVGWQLQLNKKLHDLKPHSCHVTNTEPLAP